MPLIRAKYGIIRTGARSWEGQGRPSGATPPHLLIRREAIQFNTDSDHWLDVTAFGEAIAATQARAHDRRVRCEAARLYRGELMAGSTPVPHNLPAELTLVGLAGSGKTRLAPPCARTRGVTVPGDARWIGAARLLHL